MAGIGLSRPIVARYQNVGSSVSYSNARLLGKATELSVDLNDQANNILRADNGPAESDNQFSGGTMTITTDELRPQALIAALGVVSEAITGVTGVTTPGAAWLVNDENQNIPYLGFGAIAMRQINNRIYYVGLALDKIKFNNPNDAITTRGETIEWQTPQLSGTIFRSDKPSHGWRRVTTLLSTEDEAFAALCAYFGTTPAALTPTLSALTIGSLTLDPTFASGTVAYTATSSVDEAVVTATPSNVGDVVAIEVNGLALANGGTAEFLSGANDVRITVSNSGGAQIVYTVVVTYTPA